MSNKAKKQNKYSHPSVFLRVAGYTLPTELIICSVPLIISLLSLLIRAVEGTAVAEFLYNYISIPLFILTPILITFKQISTLKKSFPRVGDDTHKVIFSVLGTSALTIFICVIMFIVSCYIFSSFPLDFKSAAYMRDMFTSSVTAMVIAAITVFVAYCLISLMTTCAFFMGEATGKKYSFTLSCLIFLLMYVLLLIIFVFAYFAATFLDIKTLETIQIENSFFNSSILCSFVTFIFISFLAFPVLYVLNYRSLKNLPTPKKKK